MLSIDITEKNKKIKFSENLRQHQKKSKKWAQKSNHLKIKK